jgi:hypothetical protein
VCPFTVQQPGFHVCHFMQQGVQQDRFIAWQHEMNVERQLQHNAFTTAGRVIPNMTESRAHPIAEAQLHVGQLRAEQARIVARKRFANEGALLSTGGAGQTIDVAL